MTTQESPIFPPDHGAPWLTKITPSQTVLPWTLLPRTLLPIAFALLATGCEEPAAPAKPLTKTVKIQTVSQQADDPVRHFTGRVAAANSAVLSFPVSGKIYRILVNTGDRVNRGQLLAAVDARPQELEVEGAQADLRKAESTYVLRSNTLRRNKELLARGFIGDAAVEQSEADVAAAQSDVNYRKSRLERAMLSLRDTKMNAPFSGVIGERFVQPNEEVGAGTRIMSLLGEDQLEVEISVPEIAIADITVGTEAVVRFAAMPTETFRGTVHEIGRVAGAGNVYPLKVALVSPPPSLRTGMTADVGLSIKGKTEPENGGGLLVPVSALKPGEAQGQGHVFVYDGGSGTAKMTPVHILSVRDNDAVVSGVEAGAQVIVAGVAFLSDGQAVRPMAPGAP